MSMNIDTEFKQNKVECSTIVTSCNQMGLFQEFKVDLALKMVQILSTLTEILENAKSPSHNHILLRVPSPPNFCFLCLRSSTQDGPFYHTQDPPATATLNYCAVHWCFLGASFSILLLLTFLCRV